jgi:3-oxoadipate enol-lactonase
MWERMVVALQSLRDDTSFLLIDLPGFGSSPVQEHWTMSSAAAEVANEILKHTRDRVVMAGLSMGGYVALAYCKKFGSLLEGLVLSNTKAVADSLVEKRNRQIFASEALRRGPSAAMSRLYPSFVTEKTDHPTASNIERWIRSAKPVAIAAGLRAMAEREDLTSLLPLISVPSLVIAGGMDRVIPTTQMREMATHLRDVSFVEIHGASHLTAVECPSDWAGALSSFLDRL